MPNLMTLESNKNVVFGERVVLGNNNVFGFPREAKLISLYGGLQLCESSPTVIEDDVSIGNNVVLHEGSKIGRGTFLDDFTRIGYDTMIGERSRLTYRAFVCDRVLIGRRARIGGFVCDSSKIGDDVTVMGSLVHEYSTPRTDWEAADEPAPVLEDRVVVGYNATVVGGVTIGSNSYIAAGAIVTKDVPSGVVVVGLNDFVKYKNWTGSKLSL